jgi:protein phosphatase methylesterase 1
MLSVPHVPSLPQFFVAHTAEPLRSSRARAPNPQFAPISAAGYFEQALQVTVPASGLEFRVYYTAPKAEDPIVMVCHHGAGWSGLTFACFAKEVATMAKGECGVMAVDMRGHGQSHLAVLRSALLILCDM